MSRSIYTETRFTDLYWLGNERCRSLFRNGEAQNVFEQAQVAVIGVAFTGRAVALARRLHVATTTNTYHLSLADPRDGIVLQTELNDHCQKLQRSSIGARRYCQLS